MGREAVCVEVRVHCSVSRHNSQQDEADDALVEELRQRIREAVRPIVDDQRYATLILYTDGLED
ncbi:hypothetical protein [Streptomyces sp. NPDC093223]|uniref:hypothetical protein n=1 Tax=Streptomyces sp. NPDC093223 TaxID=3366033 RepID=UPI0038048A0D